MSNNPRLARGVTLSTLVAVGTTSWRKGTSAVTKNRGAPGFIQGNPVLALGNRLKDDTGVVFKIQRKLLAAAETAIALLKLLGNVPVREGDEGSDASVEEVIDKLSIMVNAGLVDRIVATTERDDARPGEGEAVSLGSKRLQQGNVFLGAVIRVASSDTRGTVGNLPGLVAKGVPDGWCASILVDGALNLIAAEAMLVDGVAFSTLILLFKFRILTRR